MSEVNDQISACIAWINEMVTPIKSINKKHPAYRLKHLVEDSIYGDLCHGYVGEDSFIKAAKSLGYICKDGYFNMSFKKLKS